MFNDFFHVLRCWRHLKNKNIVMITGWFQEGNLLKNKVELSLDNRVLEYETRIFDDIHAKRLLSALGSNSREEYLLSAQLPDDFTSYQKLNITTVSSDGSKRKLSRSFDISDLVEEEFLVESWMDSVDFTDQEHPVILGWALSLTQVEVLLSDEQGNAVPHKLEWYLRDDVVTSYRGEDVEGKCGFKITLDAYTPQIKLILKTNISKSEYSLNIADLKKSWDIRHNPYHRTISKIKEISSRQYPKQIVDYIRMNGWKRFLRRTTAHLLGRGGSTSANYQVWRLQHLPTQNQLDLQRKATFSLMPKFSIVIPLYKTPKNFLLDVIHSVQRQTYSNWELCLSDGSGLDSPLKEILQELSSQDKRIRVFENEKPLQISENTNVAIQNATGDFIVFGDHDDLFTEDALFECVKAYNQFPDIDMIYSDEDKVDGSGTKFFMPHFKPDFNLDLLRTTNYICHMCVVKRDLQQGVGMLRSEFDGAQDYDFVLRCSEKAKHIYHIPKVLYHWRAHIDSTAENPESKLYAFEAGKRAVQAHYDRLNIPATVDHSDYLGWYRTTYHWKEKPLISIIIPNKDHVDDLDACVQSILQKSSYRNFEFIIVENNSTDPRTFSYYKKLEAKESTVKVVNYNGEFNYSKINNFGVTFAKGDYYLLLNNDTKIINSDCLEQLLGYCMRPDVGIVGARLCYDDNTIQHAGVIIGMGGIAGHIFVGSPKDGPGYFARIMSAQDYSAVTAACMMVKKSVYCEVGGLNEQFKVAFNDIDFCLRVRQKGYLVVYNPYAELYHFESKSRGSDQTPEKQARFQSEIDLFAKCWSDILEDGDPYYNENLSLVASDCSLR